MPGRLRSKLGCSMNAGSPAPLPLKNIRSSRRLPIKLNFDPGNYWQACVRVVHRAMTQANAQREEIVALTVSSQGQTTIAVDEQGRALRPALVWLDNRASEAARKIGAHFDPRDVYAATGNSEVVPMWTACKILWLKENEPDIFRRAFKFLLVEDFLLYRLSGRFATDGAIACSSLLWDARHGKWWDEMLAFLEITPERLAEPVLPGGIVGKLKPESAWLLGLSPNTLVIAGGVDPRQAPSARGNIRPGIVSESTGGALAILATISTHDLDPTSKLSVNVHVVPDAFLLLPCVPLAAWLSAGSAINSLKKKLPKPANKIAMPINCWMNLPPLLLRVVKG